MNGVSSLMRALPHADGSTPAAETDTVVKSFLSLEYLIEER